MPLPKTLAVPLGLGLGLVSTLAHSVGAYASTYTRKPWVTAPTDWGEFTHRRVLRPVLGVRQQIEGFVTPIEPGEFAILIANHPSTFGNIEFADYIGRFLTRSAVYVAKRDLELIFRPVFRLGIALPIDRENREEARSTVLARAPEMMRRSSLLVVFPDGTRPTQKKRDDARPKWIKRIPDFDHWSTLPPRSGALHTLLQTLDRPVRVINLTHGFNVFDEGWRTLGNLYEARYHFQAESFMSDDLPRDEDRLKAWLNHEWRRKNRQIALWRGQSRQ